MYMCLIMLRMSISPSNGIASGESTCSSMEIAKSTQSGQPKGEFGVGLLHLRWKKAQEYLPDRIRSGRVSSLQHRNRWKTYHES